jgi:methylthioribose-1-phosphate isomerase
MMANDQVRALRWDGEILHVLDQRRLPTEEHWLVATDAAETARVIHDMAVRGAPAIGLAGAYGLVMAARELAGRDAPGWIAGIAETVALLAAARPTAVNLAAALGRLEHIARQGIPGDWRALEQAAGALWAEDLAANVRMGELGAAFLKPGTRVLTHCNTGSLATAGLGTALGVIRTAWMQQRLAGVYATESRPWLQGGRLTSWELNRDGIPVNLIVDSAAAFFMARGEIDWVIVGADRITANGDVANKIGTYALAVAARHHGIRVMVVAPAATIDLGMTRGEDIPIEFRGPEEILRVSGRSAVEPLLTALNPVFDVTPAGLIDVLVTEKGIIERPDAAGLAALMGGPC